MRQRACAGVLMGLLLGVAGCGDSPTAVYREALAMQNEAADIMTMTSQSNSPMQKDRVDQIAKRWSVLLTRAEKMFGKMDSAKDKDEIRMAYVQFFDQFLEARMRLLTEQKRLAELANRLSKDEPNAASWAREMSNAPNRFNLNMIWFSNPFNISAGGSGPPMGGPPMGGPGGGMPPGGPGGGVPGGGAPGGKQ